MNQEMNKNNANMRVVFSVLRMSRALKRCPPDLGERPFPPAVGRMLSCVQMNPGVSSRELCELLDLRPSSLSEMLSRAEAEQLLTRTADETDKRVQHITLSERGESLITGMTDAQTADAAKKAACFTDEEKEQFAALCDRMSEHLEKLTIDAPMPEHGYRREERGPRFTGPERKPEFGPQGNGTDWKPEFGPHGNGPERRPEFGPHGNGPERRPEFGPHGNGPERRPEFGPHDNGPERRPEFGPHGNGPERRPEFGPHGMEHGPNNMRPEHRPEPGDETDKAPDQAPDGRPKLPPDVRIRC